MLKNNIPNLRYNVQNGFFFNSLWCTLNAPNFLKANKWVFILEISALNKTLLSNHYNNND